MRCAWRNPRHAVAYRPARHSSPFSQRLEFSRWILVYLNEDVPDMESRPTQMRAQNGRLGRTNPRRGKDLDGFFILHRRK